MVIVVIIQIDMNFIVEECFNGEYDGFGMEFQFYLGNSIDYVIVFDNKIFNCLLEDYQVWLVFQCCMYCLMVEYMICLSLGSVNCWFFVCVQYFKLDICLIDCFCYQIVECIYFFYQMFFFNIVDCWVVVYQFQSVDIVC